MTEKRPIEPGKLYWVQDDVDARFKVKVIRHAAMRDWWHCESERTGEPVVVPEGNLVPVDETAQ